MDDVARSINEMQKEITAIKVKQTNDNDRIMEFKSLIGPVEKLTVNLENLTLQLKGQNERIDKLHTSMQEQVSLQGVRHGERLGELERFKESHSLIAVKHGDRIKDVESYVEEQKTKGTKFLGGVAEKAMYTVIGAAIMFLLYRIGIG